MTAATLKRLERAAMRFYTRSVDPVVLDVNREYAALIRACAAHAHAQRKGAKRKGRR